MMTAAQYQQQQQNYNQNMRQIGTHTLGRVPSHMSPQHNAAGNKHGEHFVSHEFRVDAFLVSF